MCLCLNILFVLFPSHEEQGGDVRSKITFRQEPDSQNPDSCSSSTLNPRMGVFVAAFGASGAFNSLSIFFVNLLKSGNGLLQTQLQTNGSMLRAL